MGSMFGLGRRIVGAARTAATFSLPIRTGTTVPATATFSRYVLENNALIDCGSRCLARSRFAGLRLTPIWHYAILASSLRLPLTRAKWQRSQQQRRLGCSLVTAFRTFFSQAVLAPKKAPPASARNPQLNVSVDCCSSLAALVPLLALRCA